MVYFFTPYEYKNIGRAYNHYCSLVPNDNDWITMIDGDIMQMHMDWGSIWSQILNENENAGIVTCVTNRIHQNNSIQLCNDMFFESNIINHKKYAIEIYKKHGHKTKIMIKNNEFSGFFFSFKKNTWKTVGGFDENDILGIDNKFYNRVKQQKKCLCAYGFYVLHYYRMLEGHLYTDHLLA